MNGYGYFGNRVLQEQVWADRVPTPSHRPQKNPLPREAPCPRLETLAFLQAKPAKPISPDTPFSQTVLARAVPVRARLLTIPLSRRVLKLLVSVVFLPEGNPRWPRHEVDYPKKLPLTGRV